MDFQILTTDLAEASNYKFDETRKKKPKYSELLRAEREKLFNLDKSLKINDLTSVERGEHLIYELGHKHTSKLGGKVKPEVYGIPKYGAITKNKCLAFRSAQHVYDADEKIKQILSVFSEQFNLPRMVLREGSKKYHITRVRNLIFGFLYAHIDIDRADLIRNFVFHKDYLFRDKYRQMKYLIQFDYFARPYSECYKQLKKIIDYDFRNKKYVYLRR